MVVVVCRLALLLFSSHIITSKTLLPTRLFHSHPLILEPLVCHLRKLAMRLHLLIRIIVIPDQSRLDSLHDLSTHVRFRLYVVQSCLESFDLFLRHVELEPSGSEGTLGDKRSSDARDRVESVDPIVALAYPGFDFSFFSSLYACFPFFPFSSFQASCCFVSAHTSFVSSNSPFTFSSYSFNQSTSSRCIRFSRSSSSSLFRPKYGSDVWLSPAWYLIWMIEYSSFEAMTRSPLCSASSSPMPMVLPLRVEEGEGGQASISSGSSSSGAARSGSSSCVRRSSIFSPIPLTASSATHNLNSCNGGIFGSRIWDDFEPLLASVRGEPPKNLCGLKQACALLRVQLGIVGVLPAGIDRFRRVCRYGQDVPSDFRHRQAEG